MDVKLEGEDTFLLTYVDSSPERAQAVVNRVAEIFMKQYVDHREQEEPDRDHAEAPERGMVVRAGPARALLHARGSARPQGSLRRPAPARSHAWCFAAVGSTPAPRAGS